MCYQKQVFKNVLSMSENETIFERINTIFVKLYNY